MSSSASYGKMIPTSCLTGASESSVAVGRSPVIVSAGRYLVCELGVGVGVGECGMAVCPVG